MREVVEGWVVESVEQSEILLFPEQALSVACIGYMFSILTATIFNSGTLYGPTSPSFIVLVPSLFCLVIRFARLWRS